MSTPETGSSRPWNTEVAVTLFQELAAMQVTSGVFAAYLKSIQDYLKEAPDNASEIRAALYTEIPLGVMTLTKYNDPGDERPEMWLVKVDPLSGKTIIDSIFFTGYSIDEQSQEAVQTYPDTESPYFSEGHARLLYNQWQLQQEAGLEFDDV